VFNFEWDDTKAVSNRRNHGVSFDEAVTVFGSATRCASSAHERPRSMSKRSTKADEQDIPELTREQLGKGVRGKYLKRYTQGSNVVVLKPELQKAFPTSQAVNDALASYLAFAREAKSLTARTGPRTAKRKVA
jgi:hypothetical protein